LTKKEPLKTSLQSYCFAKEIFIYVNFTKKDNQPNMIRIRGVGRSVTPQSFFSSSFSTLPTTNVCIVGSGPSGLYSAKYLLKDDASVKVDVIDYLPSPFGT